MIKENVKYFDAVVAGVQKCGTTSLIRYLKQHPDIFVPWNKEKDRDPRWWGDWTGDIDHKMLIISKHYPELIKFIRRGVHIINLKDKPPMDGVKEELIEHYRKKNKGLDEIIDKNLSRW